MCHLYYIDPHALTSSPPGPRAPAPHTLSLYVSLYVPQEILDIAECLPQPGDKRLDAQVGKKKVFMRNNVYNTLEHSVARLQTTNAIQVQTWSRARNSQQLVVRLRLFARCPIWGGPPPSLGSRKGKEGGPRAWLAVEWPRAPPGGTSEGLCCCVRGRGGAGIPAHTQW